MFGQQVAHSRVYTLARVEVAVAKGDALLLLLRHTAGVAEGSNIEMKEIGLTESASTNASIYTGLDKSI